MQQQASNPRSRRTEQMLRDALLSLIVEKGYEKTTVQDILDRADVGRATFYMHFQNKEQLLRNGMNKLRELLVQASHPSTASPESLAFSLEFFRHVDGHRRLYKALVGREGGAVIDRELRKLLAELIRRELSHSRVSKRDVELAVQYVVGGMMSAVTWWMDYNVKITPEEVDQAFRKMTLPGLAAIFAR